MIIAKKSRFTKLTLGLLLGLNLSVQASDRSYVRDFAVAAGALLGSYGVYNWFKREPTPLEKFKTDFEEFKKTGFDRRLDGKTLLIRAIELEQAESAQYLIELAPMMIGLNDSLGESPLHYAVRAKNQELVELLLEKKPNLVNGQTLSGLTPAMIAIAECDFALVYCKIADILLDQEELNTDIKCSDNASPINYDRKRDNRTIEDFALGLRQNLSYKKYFIAKINRLNDLMQLINSGKFKEATALILQDADLKYLDRNNRSVLDWAIISENLDLVRLIVQKQPSLLVNQDKDGRTPLMNAIINFKDIKGFQVVSYLIQFYIDPSNTQYSATHRAFEFKDIYGKTAVDLSREKKSLFDSFSI